MDAEHGLGESDFQATEGTRCCSKLELSAQKSECSFFTTNSCEASWLPALYVSKQKIIYNPNPKFLGITCDRQLSFDLHASVVCSRIKQQAGALWCLASTDWGYEKSVLLSTYIATAGPTVMYAAAALLPWVSASTMDKLEMCQRYAVRTVTGQIKTTHVKVILAEVDLPTVATRATQLSTIAMEKFL